MSTWIPDSASVVDALCFLIGALGISAWIRWWTADLDRRTISIHLALTALLFCVPLLSPRYQLPLDYVYQFDPWRDAVDTPPEEIQNPLLTDVALQMIPFRTLVRDRLLHGRAPLWSHELGTGQPLLGNAQSAPFAPLHLLTLPLPPLRSLTVAAALQVFISLLFMHLLAKQLGASPRGALLAAIAYGLSVFQIGWLYHPLSMVSAWLPGVLLSLERLHSDRPRAALGLVLTLGALIASGNPGVGAICLGICLLWWLALVARGKQRREFVLRSGAALLIACGLTAPIWLPLTETVPLSERALALEQASELVQPPPWDPARLATLVSPYALGSPRDGNWTGDSNFLELSTGYCGLLTLCLAWAGAASMGGRRLWWAVAGLLALGVALGLPPLYDWVSRLPLISRMPLGRLRLAFVLATALGAGFTVDRVAAARGARITASALLGAGLLAIQITGPDAETLWQGTSRAVVSIGLATLLASLWIDRMRPHLPAIAVGFLFLELALFGLRFHPLVPSDYDLAPPKVVRHLQERMRQDEAIARFSALDGRLLPYLGATYGLWDPRGFDPMRPAAALQLLRQRLDRPSWIGMFLQRAPIDQGFLDFLAVRYLLTGPEDEPGEVWRAIERDGRVVAWENDAALPLFFVPERVVSCGARDAAAGFVRTNHDFRALTCVGDDRTAYLQSGSVEILSVEPNGFRLRVSAANPTLIASSVTWMPGWRLRVDGRRAPTKTVNQAFLGAAVAAGSHELAFDYTPWQWRAGWIFCLIAVAAVGLLRRSW